ncbi:hypothetical protein V8G54_022150 [Vigna mungo]|uniref:Uncharacterized protein n=1 Tax=Vigna mungo TaxID=3915 RepID=A0AAQ3NEN3_VIGMU
MEFIGFTPPSKNPKDATSSLTFTMEFLPCTLHFTISLCRTSSMTDTEDPTCEEPKQSSKSATKDLARLVVVLVDGAREKGVARFVGFGCEALEGAVSEGRRGRGVSRCTVEPEERTSQTKNQFGGKRDDYNNFLLFLLLILSYYYEV